VQSARNRLVKVYSKGLQREAPKSYLDLEQPAPLHQFGPPGTANK